MVWVILVLLVVGAFLYLRAQDKTGPTAKPPTGSHPPTGAADRTETTPRRTAPTPTSFPKAGAGSRVKPRTVTHNYDAGPLRDKMPFATPGMRGQMFSYAGPSSREATHEHTGPFAVVDVQTTGLSPGRGDRVVEVAITRVDALGRVEDSFSTLVNPEGRDTGPEWLHAISNDDVRSAPTFKQVVPELLSRMDGAVLVAHNAPFDEAFLSEEFKRAGVTGLRMPAICTLWLSQQTFKTPNHQLRTLARHANIPLVGKVALANCQVTGELLGTMLRRYGKPLRYDCAPYRVSAAMDRSSGTKVITRATGLRKGTTGYMDSLMARLPMSANDADDAFVEQYFAALGDVLTDGKIVAEEAKQLAELVGAAGLGGPQVAALNERFLESLRQAAFEDDVLTAAELRQLNTAAKALGVPDYFSDLSPTVSGAQQSAPDTPVDDVTANTSSSAMHAANGSGAARARRCGHCREPGHYRSTCPELAGA